jgi:hypothetical protein
MFVFDVRSGSTEGRRRMGERGGAMTVISLQKQPGRSSVTVREGPVRQFWRPQVYQPATRVAEPLLAVDTSDFDRCLQLVGASHARAAVGMYGAGPGGYFNLEARFCCRFAADAARRNCRCNSWLRQANGPGASRMYRHRRMQPLFSPGQPRVEPVLSRLDVRPTKKYTSALS